MQMGTFKRCVNNKKQQMQFAHIMSSISISSSSSSSSSNSDNGLNQTLFLHPCQVAAHLLKNLPASLWYCWCWGQVNVNGVFEQITATHRWNPIYVKTLKLSEWITDQMCQPKTIAIIFKFYRMHWYMSNLFCRDLIERIECMCKETSHDNTAFITTCKDIWTTSSTELTCKTFK